MVRHSPLCSLHYSYIFCHGLSTFCLELKWTNLHFETRRINYWHYDHGGASWEVYRLSWSTPSREDRLQMWGLVFPTPSPQGFSRPCGLFVGLKAQKHINVHAYKVFKAPGDTHHSGCDWGVSVPPSLYVGPLGSDSHQQTTEPAPGRVLGPLARFHFCPP